MGEELNQYFERLIQHIPIYVFVALLLSFFLGVVWLLYKKKSTLRYISKLAFIEYTVMLFCSTVVFRDVKAVRKIKYVPFWSYAHPDLLIVNLMNILVFVPIGVLLGFANNRLKWWHVLLIGTAISMSIELLQLAFKRGFFEFDDLIHNVLGCLIGYGVYVLFSALNMIYQKKRGKESKGLSSNS